MLDATTGTTSARAAIERDGVLMLQDPALPSLARLVAGEPVRGSWWAHPAGAHIFAVASALDDDADVTTTKLVAGKVTFVHRRLWPAVIAIGRAREPWQLASLPTTAHALLERVDTAQELDAGGDDAKLLGARLLVHATQRHTASGRHETVLQSWSRFADLHHVAPPFPSPTEARAELERTIATWAGAASAPLPWQPRARKRP